MRNSINEWKRMPTIKNIGRKRNRKQKHKNKRKRERERKHTRKYKGKRKCERKCKRKCKHTRKHKCTRKHKRDANPNVNPKWVENDATERKIIRRSALTESNPITSLLLLRADRPSTVARRSAPDISTQPLRQSARRSAQR